MGYKLRVVWPLQLLDLNVEVFFIEHVNDKVYVNNKLLQDLKEKV
jgi:hypothetical protein